MVSLSPIRLAFGLPLAVYIVVRVATLGLSWTTDALFATVGFGFLASLPFVLPRRGREAWPFAIGVVGAAVGTFAVAQYPFDPANAAVVLAADLSVAGLVSFPIAAALWGSLQRAGAGWQVLLLGSSVVGTILLVAGAHAAPPFGPSPTIVLLPWGVNSIEQSQGGALLGQVSGFGPPGAPPLSSALDPTFVAVALLSLAGSALSWAIPQTDRGVPLPLRRRDRVEPLEAPPDPSLRFLSEDDRARLDGATAPSPPPLLAYPTIRPFVLSALVTVSFVAYTLARPDEVLFVLAVAATGAAVAVYAFGRPPLRRVSHPRTSTPP